MDRDRRMLCQAGGLLLASAALPSCNMQPVCPDNAFDTGLKPSDVAQNQAQPIISSTRAVFICHDGDGYYALDANCTHHGCFVNFVIATTSFSCPCHFATFDFNGDKPTAPAPTPMPHYQLCVNKDGNLEVDLTNVVASNTRLKL
jgi:cytochrome b6-f complex iron-sulfur subunit